MFATLLGQVRLGCNVTNGAVGIGESFRYLVLNILSENPEEK